MRAVYSRLFVATLAATAIVASFAPAAGARDRFIVPVGAQSSGFGPFVEQPGRNGVAPLVRAFGDPSSRVLGRGGATCTLRWTPLGIRASLTNFGQEFNPCARGIFTEARLTDRRWYTGQGIRPGSAESAARVVSKRRCTRDRCGVTGYALGLHRSDCAGGLVPSVVAEVRDAKVVALRVYSRGCE